MQVKTTMRRPLTPIKMATIKKNRKQQVLERMRRNVHRWWECKMVQPLQKTVQRFLKKLKVELAYGPAIPLLDTYPKELKAESQRGMCTPMFIASLLTISNHGGNPGVHQQMNG